MVPTTVEALLRVSSVEEKKKAAPRMPPLAQRSAIVCCSADFPEPAAPVEVVLALFAGLERMFREWPELLGLFLTGAVLSMIRLRTGQLYLGIGIHAGWYWIKQVDRAFVQEVETVIESHRLLLGSSQYLDGIVGWIALLGTLAFAMQITSRHLPR